jgi:hypothetical protein
MAMNAGHWGMLWNAMGTRRPVGATAYPIENLPAQAWQRIIASSGGISIVTGALFTFVP